MHHTSCKDTEIQFGRDDSPSETIVYAFADTGQITITVQDTEVHSHACDNELSLGQTIQLRDFLNRHIDGLALAATGSLAVRSSDDPTQLASEEFIAAVQEGIADAEAGNLVSLNEVRDKWADRRHPDPVPSAIPVDDHEKSVLLGNIAVLAVQAQNLFQKVDGALQMAGHATDQVDHATAHPQRWLQAARMEIQTGLMKLERAVKNPANW